MDLSLILEIHSIYPLIMIESRRTKNVRSNIALSLISKGVTIVTSLLIVPLTISYVNPTQYGIWLTLSSIISWIGFMDLGLGNGFRNRFAKARAENNDELANQYVTTTYVSVGVIFISLFVLLSFVNSFVDWSKLLNVSQSYRQELKYVFLVLIFFFCQNMIVRIFSTLLTADQKPGISAIINAVSQVLSLLSVFVLTKVSTGKLLNLALFYSGIPTFVLLCCSIYAFRFTRYRYFRPRIKLFNRGLIKEILNLGVQFFAISLSLLLIFQVINIVISRVLGPESVTLYNIASKYFSIIFMLFTIVLTPLWSAFTEAYAVHDFEWMRGVLSKMEKFWFVAIIVSVFMFAVSPFVYKIWIGDSIHIPRDLSLFMAIYVLAQSLANIYMYLLNGIGTVRIQLIIYSAFAIISLPILTIMCKNFGLVGVLILPTFVFVCQAVVGKIQISKILSGSASGIWLK